MHNMIILALAGLLSVHCAQKAKTTPTLESVVNSAERSQDNKQRDTYRNPVETLKFFEVEPEMTVVEVSPGRGWYTEILAPYLQGKLYLAAFNENSEREYFRKSTRQLKEKVNQNKELYGDVEFTVLEVPKKVGPIAPANSVDRVLTFRNVHNWQKAGKAQEVFNEFYRVLKKGGILGVVEHRANPKMKKDPKANSGYMHTKDVLSLAKNAGFKLVAQSEINANPKDTTQHPKGVWSLPPSLSVPEKDKEKYKAIGESDRMTLKFVKPF
jgi:predicted methyltransferase